MIDRLWKALSRDRLRREAAQRRLDIIAEDRRKALEALQQAIANRDKRGEGERFPAAFRATNEALRAGR